MSKYRSKSRINILENTTVSIVYLAGVYYLSEVRLKIYRELRD